MTHRGLPHHQRPGRRQRGISAVEILIGTAVGLLLLSGLTSMVLGSRQTSRVERHLMEVQGRGRIAVETLAREVRKAGFRSDRSRALADLFPVAAAPFTLAGAVVSGRATGDGVDVRFQGSGDTWTTDCLGNVVPMGQDLWQTLWLQGDQVQCRTRNLIAGTDQTLALIPGVEAISLTYGIDTDGDGFADVYQDAASVANWAAVASVNVQVRVVSAEDGLFEGPQAYTDFTGTGITPTDRRLRRTYATVVALRNLLP